MKLNISEANLTAFVAASGMYSDWAEPGRIARRMLAADAPVRVACFSKDCGDLPAERNTWMEPLNKGVFDTQEVQRFRCLRCGIEVTVYRAVALAEQGEHDGPGS